MLTIKSGNYFKYYFCLKYIILNTPKMIITENLTKEWVSKKKEMLLCELKTGQEV